MGVINLFLRKYKKKLVYAHKYKLQGNDSDFKLATLKDMQKYTDKDLRVFLGNGDYKLSICFLKNKTILNKFLESNDFIVTDAFKKYINNDKGVFNIVTALKKNVAAQINHPIFLIEKGDEIIYVTGTHGTRFDLLYIETKEGYGTVNTERFVLNKEVVDSIELGVPFFYVNKNNSLIYKMINEDAIFNKYELTANLIKNKDLLTNYERTILESWLKKYNVNNSSDFKGRFISDLLNTREKIFNYNGELVSNKKMYSMHTKEELEFVLQYNKSIDCEKTLEDYKVLKDLIDNLKKKIF